MAFPRPPMRFLSTAATLWLLAWPAAAASPPAEEPSVDLIKRPGHANFETADTGVSVTYQVHFGGFRLASASFRATLQDGEYEAESRAKTAGLLTLFTNSDVHVGSRGLVPVAQTRPQPQRYTADLVDRKKRQFVELIYGETGPEKILSKPQYNYKKRNVPDAQKKQTIDPASAILAMSLTDADTSANPCGEPIQIYDGRRRFDVAFKFVDVETVSVGRQGVYRGPATRCIIYHTEIAGFKKKDRDIAEWPPWHVWFGAIEGTPFRVPVRLEARTPYGVGVAAIASIDKKRAAEYAAPPLDGASR
ncbi:MAG: DUF3108 domain-containing protein [Pseudomonadota bacterium]